MSIFQKETKNNDEDGNPPVKKRAVSKGVNEPFGDHLVVNEGHGPQDMDVWYLQAESADKASQIRQQDILTEISRKSKKAHDAFTMVDRDGPQKMYDPGDCPDWVQGVVEEENLTGSDFQLHFEQVINNVFRGYRIEPGESGEHESWLVEVTPQGYLTLLTKVETRDRFPGHEWTTIRGGTVEVSEPEIVTEELDIEEGEDGDAAERETVETPETTIHILDDDDEYTLGRERIKDIVAGAVRESDDLRYGEKYGLEVEVNDNESVIRLVVEDACYTYIFRNLPDVNLAFGIPEWMVKILREDQRNGVI